MKRVLAISLLCTLVASCISTPAKKTPKPPSTDFKIPFERFTLDNGLTVLLHEDHSDPIVALATVVHVGSNREKPGRTGFAHFFEHMSFNDSENVPKGANRKLIPELGGQRNGGTWSDGTIYYEVVPVDAFDKLLWIDSDRFGYMINTVTEPTLEREKQVVKNEKRQRVDNRAYGYTSQVIQEALYPPGHPYHWTTIGKLEDLQNATLEDVREFYRRYYVPSNATLVIAGDIDIAQAKAKVKAWFGEIKPGKPVADLKPQPVTLDKTTRLYHLDNFAKLPELQITFPTVPEYHPDSYALKALGSILAEGKGSPLFTALVSDGKLAPSVTAEQSSQELAGTFGITVRANEGVSLNRVYKAIYKALRQFEQEGVRDKDLARIKADQETRFYNKMASVLSKSLQLGIYNEFAGDPDYAGKDIADTLAVSKADIIRVYEKYIKNQPAVITSFVPKEQASLVLEGSKEAVIKQEAIVSGTEKTFEEQDYVDYVKTPSVKDRSEPPLGHQPKVKLPQIWRQTTDNGIRIYGIEQKELPLVTFSLRIDGGQWLDLPDKLGTADLLAQLMREGTAQMTPEQLEDAVGMLGATLQVEATREGIEIRGNVLARHFDKLFGFVSDVVLSPRWDESLFDRIKSRRLTRIRQLEGNPNAVASQVFTRQIYGKHHLGGQPMGGSLETVENITLADLQQWYRRNLSPDLASFHIVGDIEPLSVHKALGRLSRQWQRKTVEFPKLAIPQPVEKPRVYFVDFPNARQSVLYVGKATLNGSDPLYDSLTIANNRLGSGSSARLMQVLRIEKGYTYGASSGITRHRYTGTFVARTQVRSNVTLESLAILKDLIGDYGKRFDDEDLSVTKNLIGKSFARRFETQSQLTRVLEVMSEYALPDDYIERQQSLLEHMNLSQLRDIVKRYINEQQMIYVVVGDAKTQLEKVRQLGYGSPVLVDIHGEPL